MADSGPDSAQCPTTSPSNESDPTWLLKSAPLTQKALQQIKKELDALWFQRTRLNASRGFCGGSDVEAVLYTCDFCRTNNRALLNALPGYIPMGWRVLGSKQQDQVTVYEPTATVRALMCEVCYLKTREFWASLGPETDQPKRRKFNLNDD